MGEQRDAQEVVRLQTVLRALLPEMMVRIVESEVHDIRVFPFAQQVELYRNLVMGRVAYYGDNAIFVQNEVVRDCLRRL